MDEDEETLEWEREQLRRGGHNAAIAMEPTPVKEIYKAAQSRSVIRFVIRMLTPGQSLLQLTHLPLDQQSNDFSGH